MQAFAKEDIACSVAHLTFGTNLRIPLKFIYIFMDSYPTLTVVYAV